MVKFNCPNCNREITINEYIYFCDACKYCIDNKKGQSSRKEKAGLKKAGDPNE